jgi:hypothetical protein
MLVARKTRGKDLGGEPLDLSLEIPRLALGVASVSPWQAGQHSVQFVPAF